MTPSFYEIQWLDVFASSMLVIIAIGLIRWWKLDLESSLIIGTIRTFIQLSIMGFVLKFFFRQHHWSFMVSLILVMILIASFEGYRRQRKDVKIPHLFIILFSVLLFTTTLVLGTILNFVLHVKPWYYPYAMIPIAGMIIGNALNSISLTINRFTGELEHREKEIELYLSLGASPRAAVLGSMKTSIKAALLPTINSMMMVGIVQIPGVMTGQILSGIDPLIAVRYQIMIMYMWVTTAVLANILVLAIIYRQFFTPRFQLKKELIHRS